MLVATNTVNNLFCLVDKFLVNELTSEQVDELLVATNIVNNGNHNYAL